MCQAISVAAPKIAAIGSWPLAIRSPHRPAFERLFKNPLEGLETGVVAEQPHAAHAAVQDVEPHPGAELNVRFSACLERSRSSRQQLDSPV